MRAQTSLVRPRASVRFCLFPFIIISRMLNSSNFKSKGGRRVYTYNNIGSNFIPRKLVMREKYLETNTCECIDVRLLRKHVHSNFWFDPEAIFTVL